MQTHSNAHARARGAAPAGAGELQAHSALQAEVQHLTEECRRLRNAAAAGAGELRHKSRDLSHAERRVKRLRQQLEQKHASASSLQVGGVYSDGRACLAACSTRQQQSHTLQQSWGNVTLAFQSKHCGLQAEIPGCSSTQLCPTEKIKQKIKQPMSPGHLFHDCYVQDMWSISDLGQLASNIGKRPASAGAPQLRPQLPAVTHGSPVQDASV